MRNIWLRASIVASIVLLMIAASSPPGYSRSPGTAKAYTPGLRATERRQIAAAIAKTIKNTSGARLSLHMRHLKIQRRWAWAYVLPSLSHGGLMPARGVLLHYRNNHWLVVKSYEGKKIPKPYSKVRAQFPSAPAAIFAQ